jgi:hypothetical protein
MHLSKFDWLKLPLLVRLRLRRDLEIPRSGGNILDGQRLVSDGHTDENLATITIEKLQAYLGSEDDSFETLWEATVLKATQDIEAEEKAEESRLFAEKAKPVMLTPEQAEEYRKEFEARKNKKEVYIKLRKPEDILPIQVKGGTSGKAKKKK